MAHELDPREVQIRLAELRALYQPEGIEDARERLARERPFVRESLAMTVASSLAELRALCELARYLQHTAPSLPSTEILAAIRP